MPAAITPNQLKQKGGIFKVEPSRVGTTEPGKLKPVRMDATLDTLQQMALANNKKNNPFQPFKPSTTSSKSSGSGNPLLDMFNGVGVFLGSALGGIGAAITGNINAIEQSRQNFVGGIEQSRQEAVGSIKILPGLKDGTAPILNITPKGGVCGEDCDSLGNPVSISGCKARKYLHGCGHPGGNQDIAGHDQDCANYMGFGGLLDGICVAGKGGTKAKDEWIIPLAIGGVLIIGLVVVMK